MSEFSKAIFTFDDEDKFEGYTSGLTWNGWQVPLFTKEQVEPVITYLNQNPDGVKLSWENSEIKVLDDDISFLISPRLCNIDGDIHLYELSLGLVWELFEEQGE